MYYETQTHEALPVENALEAARKIKAGELNGYQVPTFTAGFGKQLYIVADAAFGSFFEVAVIMKDGEEFTQIESITAGWCDTPEELADYFNKAVTDPISMGKASLIFNAPTGTETASFECGCCGTGFTGNVKKQLAYDQDAGYGICEPCARLYYRNY